MKERVFRRIITAICIIGTLITIALVLYTYHLHETCSILTFIANERG
ncbi:MAG: hypothetical protein IKM30_00030 [Oscillospiraceae bacterium]|nr:hypothetical protein [Oscillospiraceae bacterium]